MSCDGDVTGFGGGHAASEAHRLLALHAANSTAADWAARLTKRVCHGTLRLAWACPAHRAAACAECKGTHVWIKAPCGATVAVCDGLLHKFAKISLPHDKSADGSGTKLFIGAGALGVTTSVKAPFPHHKHHHKEAEEDASPDSSTLAKKHGLPVGKRRTVAHWSADGVSGRVVSHKPLDWHRPGAAAADNDASIGDGSELMADAKAAFAEDGLVLLPPGSEAGAAVASAEPAPPQPANVSAVAKPKFTFTCNDDASYPVVPCVGSTVFRMPSDGVHPSVKATCDGAWSGRLGFVCAGLHTGTSDYKAPSNGGHPPMRVHSQCSGKHASKFLVTKAGMAEWCRGRSAGAALVKHGDDDALPAPK